MSRFNTAAASTRTVNKAGGVAFSMNAAQELVHAVLTTFLDDKFYESGNDRIDRIKKLVAKNDPIFVANLAVIARKEFNLRSVTHVLLGELAKVHNGDSLVKDAIYDGAIRPDDLLEIAAYVGKPMPKQVKRGIRNALLKFNRYQLAKYRGEGKAIKMVDLFNLTHPRAEFATGEQREAWADLMAGKLISFDTWETEISNSKTDAERAKIWGNLIAHDKVGYMALLRNLNNLTKYGVSETTKKRAIAKLTNPEEVAKSKQLPFRFYTAYMNVANDRQYADAISEAMDLSLGNLADLGGRTLIAVDTSGSMTSGGDGGAIKKAAIFAAALIRANKNADVILYDTSVKELTVSGRTPVIDLAHRIEKEAMGGGTETSLVFQYANTKGIIYDRFIILSDNESWREHSVQRVYTDYKRVNNTDPYVYAIDIQGYGTKDMSGGKVFHLTGWADRLLDFIEQAEKGEMLVEYVKNYEIQKQVLKEASKKVVKKSVKKPLKTKAKVKNPVKKVVKKVSKKR